MTTIEWTDVTWNPVTGCTKVSAGCKHCYAERAFPRVYSPRKFTDVQCHPARLDAPLHWRKPRMVFVNSMSDLFHSAVRGIFIDQVFAVMALTPQHTYQILTKRPERMQQYAADAREYVQAIVSERKPASPPRHWYHAPDNRIQWPLPNVWLGVSVEDQATADERIPMLWDTPAAVRFVSCEPLLGLIDLSPYLQIGTRTKGVFRPDIDWVIVGGESGPGARPCNIDWIRDILSLCRVAGVPAFCKQLGARPTVDDPGCERNLPWLYKPGFFDDEHPWMRLDDRKGANPDEWPSDLRVREYPASLEDKR